MKIYLIRHAETVHNVGHAWYRQPFICHSRISLKKQRFIDLFPAFREALI